jgi:competence protein ComEC
MKLVYISLVFILGIYSGSHFRIPPGTALLTIAAILFAAILLQIIKTRWRIREFGAIIFGIACIVIFICGALRFAATSTGDDLQRYTGLKNISVTGVIMEEPEATNASVKVILSVQEVDGETASGNLLVRTSRYPSLEYGDLLKVTGDLELPPDDLNGFKYRAYLEGQGIYTSMYYPDVELVSEGQGPQPLRAIYYLRHRLGEALRQSLPEPESSLARGILLGLRGDIPDSMNEAFQRSGTTHILAISGQNMAIIAGIVLSVATRLFGKHRPTYFIITLAILWLYALLAGMSAPVLRAVIMVSIYLLGIYIGRQRSGLTATVFSAAVMIAINPNILWQISFQLSFAAVLGLILLTPIFQDWLSRFRMPKLVSDSLSVGLGAIMATLPLTSYYFGYTSLVTLPATFFAALVLPAIIMITAAVAIIGLVWIPAASIIGWIDWLLLKYFVLVVQGFAAIPHASIEIAQVKAWLVWSYYGLMTAIMWLISKIKRLFPKKDDALIIFEALSISTPIKWGIATLLVIATVIWAAVFTAPETGKLQVSFIDVGQGDAILIKSPSNHYVLVDGGPNPEAICLALGEALPFWNRNVDMVVLTHQHDDHANGLIEVVQRYNVKQVLYPPDQLYKGENSGYLPGSLELSDTILNNGVNRITAQAGQIIDIGGAIIEVLNPPESIYEDTDSDIDNNGVVLRVSMGEISFLLSADMYWDGELLLVCEQPVLQSTVLKVGHHGSKSSTRPYYLSAVNPQVAVISVGAGNRFGHPSGEVLERLNPYIGEEVAFTTMDQGTITFTTDGKRLWLDTER